MNLHKKIVLSVAVIVFLHLGGLVIWTLQEEKRLITSNVFSFLQGALDNFYRHTVAENYEILRQNELVDVSSYRQQYRQDIFVSAEGIADQIRSHVSFYDADNQLLYRTGMTALNHDLVSEFLAQLPVTGETICSRQISTLRDHYFCGVFSPAWNMAVIFSVDEHEIHDEISASIGRIIFLYVSVMVSLMGLMYVVLRRLIFSKTQSVLTTMANLSAGNLKARVRDLGTDELGHIARSFNETLDRLAEETVSRNRLEQEVKERRRAEEKANDALDRLKKIQAQLVHAEKMAALGTLVGGVAHEINNPLMGLMAYVDYARKKASEGKPREVLERAMEELDRIAKIVQNMLLFSRGGAIGRTSFDLIEAINLSLNVANVALKRSNIDIAVDLPDNLPPVHGPRDGMQQVFLNIFLNARDAMENREIKRLAISARCDGQFVEVAIQDTGPGIPEAVLPRIFDPFFTTKPFGKGTGLGLSISHGIINDAGGSLTAGNTPEGGACFVIRLQRVS